MFQILRNCFFSSKLQIRIPMEGKVKSHLILVRFIPESVNFGTLITKSFTCVLFVLVCSVAPSKRCSFVYKLCHGFCAKRKENKRNFVMVKKYLDLDENPLCTLLVVAGTETLQTPHLITEIMFGVKRCVSDPSRTTCVILHFSTMQTVLALTRRWEEKSGRLLGPVHRTEVMELTGEMRNFQ